MNMIEKKPYTMHGLAESNVSGGVTDDELGRIFNSVEIGDPVRVETETGPKDGKIDGKYQFFCTVAIKGIFKHETILWADMVRRKRCKN